MVSLEIINGEIADLESRTPTYTTMERLAWLYIVRDHNTISSAAAPVVISAKTAENTITYDSGTEFSKAINGRKASDVLPLLDEMMQMVQVAYPKLYSAVMDKLR